METKPIETDAADDFAGRMLEILNDGALALMTSIGHRAGLFDVLAELPPSSSESIAERAGLHERYVREWLAAMACGGIVDHDPGAGLYHLPPHRAACLTRAAGPENIAGTTQFLPLLASVEERLVDCFRRGGGIPYDAYSRFHAVMAEDSAAIHDASLVDGVLPLVPGLTDALESGIEVLDLGCGRGHAVNVMGRAYPRSRFTGVDIARDAVEAGREEALRMGLDNVRHEVRDAASLGQSSRYDLVTAFDAIHDQAAPARVLENVLEALRPGAPFLMVDFAASSRVENNLDHFVAPFLYTVSCMHCVPVSLAEGGPGLGTMWGEEVATRMLAEAGFVDISIERMAGDPFNDYYVARRPA